MAFTVVLCVTVSEPPRVTVMSSDAPPQLQRGGVNVNGQSSEQIPDGVGDETYLSWGSPRTVQMRLVGLLTILIWERRPRISLAILPSGH